MSWSGCLPYLDYAEKSPFSSNELIVFFKLDWQWIESINFFNSPTSIWNKYLIEVDYTEVSPILNWTLLIIFFNMTIQKWTDYIFTSWTMCTETTFLTGKKPTDLINFFHWTKLNKILFTWTELNRVCLLIMDSTIPNWLMFMKWTLLKWLTKWSNLNQLSLNL